MIFPRHRLLLLMACGLFGQGAMGQESTGDAAGTASGAGTGAGAGTGTTGVGNAASGKPAASPTGTPSGATPGASSTFGAPPTGDAPSLFGSEPLPPPNKTPSTPSFRTGEAAPGTGTDQPGTPPGAASNFGTEQQGGAGLTRSAPTTFTVPGSYGRGGQSFVVGEGRLARPKFRFNGKVSNGYDDNVFQTPTHGASRREQRLQILVQPGSPATTAFVEVPSGDPLVPASVEQVEIPAVEPKFRTQRIPGIQAPERLGSLVTRTSVGFDIQLANRRNLFTFDFDAGNSYYWDRPGKKNEYNGSLSMIYVRKLTGRAQFTFTLAGTYQSQPNFSQINSPSSNQRGSYLSTNAKGDLSYRLTPRFSTTTSVSYNSLAYMETSEQTGDFAETTFGTELRYLFSPRLTLLGELRYSSSMHEQSAGQDTTSYFLLVGGELTLTRRFTASIRIGETMQTYTESGRKSSSPYVETSLNYRLARGTTIEWNGRYGFEESGAEGSQSTVARTGIALTHIFSPRLQASVSMNLVHNSTTSSSQVAVEDTSAATTTPATTTAATTTPTTTTDPNAPVDPNAPATTTPATTATDTTSTPKKAATPKTRTVSTESVQDTVDASIGLHYILSRRWAFNLNYTYTMALGPEETNDYYRQQIFFGAEFTF